MFPGMLTPRYQLPLSPTSSAARDAYVQGCEAKLTMYPGAIEGFDRAIAADPRFALAHAPRANGRLERGDTAAAPAPRRRGPPPPRVHQRPDRQFRPRRAETRAAGARGQACPSLRRRLVVHGPSRHGPLGEWTARGGPPQD